MNMFKLYLSFVVIVIIAIGSAFFTITKMRELTINTQKMYTHPFQVSNAVSAIQTSIVTMHRNMKDVVLTPNSLEMIKIIESIQMEEDKIHDEFETIYKYYLGNKNDIDTLYEAFKSWKDIRQEVITLAHEEKLQEAITITKGKGKKHIDNLYIQIDVLKNYASNKAATFYNSSVKTNGIDQVIAVFLFSMIVSSIIIIYIVLNLLKANRSNNKQLHLIDQNILTATIDLNKKVINISNSLCRELNLQKKELLNRKNEYFFTNEEQYRNFETIIYSAKEYKGEVYIKIEGTSVWFELEIFPELDENFNLVSFNIFLNNISDKKRIEEVSITDKLTGLYNRNYFEMIFDKEVRRSKRDNKPLGMVMLDIDYFKQFNDNYGHQEGDNALKAVAHILSAHTNRSYDYAFRVGGEEFVLLSYQKDFQMLENFADTVLKEIEALKISHKGSEVSSYLTSSAGVILFGKEHLLNTDDMYKEVDKLLYEAKHNGKNGFKSVSID